MSDAADEEDEDVEEMEEETVGELELVDMTTLKAQIP